ncbi:MAG: ATP-dependent metallopeptidase FtsH/Yme1/Tma family protein, partial [Bacteroidales bacterium]|nr:ATP-dependent metallopeptidase FtsH/Yme1/Tma family protein [Bacteroidales bacterium]
MEQNKQHKNQMPQSGNKKPRMRFNVYWIYAIILIGLLGANMFGSANGGVQEISWTKMESYITENKIDKLTCYTNKNLA